MASEYRSVYVEWLDHASHSQHGWKPLEDVEEMEPVVIRTLGFVVKESSDFITLVASMPGDEYSKGVDGEMCIIKAAILKMVNVVHEE